MYDLSWLYHLTECDQWHSLDEPKLAQNVARYGHSAVDYDGQMFVFGGFNGLLLRDLLVFKPGRFGFIIYTIILLKSVCRCSQTAGRKFQYTILIFDLY